MLANNLPIVTLALFGKFRTFATAAARGLANNGGGDLVVEVGAVAATSAAHGRST